MPSPKSESDPCATATGPSSNEDTTSSSPLDGLDGLDDLDGALQAMTGVWVKMLRDIDRDGLCVVTVDGRVPFAYTVGLEKTWGHPELIVHNTSPLEVGQLLLDAVTTQFVAKKVALAAGQTLAAATLRLPVDLRVHKPTRALLEPSTAETPHSDVCVPLARRYYDAHPLPDGRAVRFLQIVWPSAACQWPSGAASVASDTSQVLL